MRNTFLVLCLAFLISVISAETIKKSCYRCGGCPKGICLSYDGGPFNSNVGCSNSTSCGFISGSYDIGCSCSLGCGYTASFDGSSVSGCSTLSDPYWALIQYDLDIAYALFNGGTYDWCSGVCTGPVIGVVIGVLVGVGIIVAIIIWRRKKAAANQSNHRLMDNQSPY
jgi:hypothetical protein